LRNSSSASGDSRLMVSLWKQKSEFNELDWALFYRHNVSLGKIIRKRDSRTRTRIIQA
jgi:hypothetical protein